MAAAQKSARTLISKRDRGVISLVMQLRRSGGDRARNPSDGAYDERFWIKVASAQREEDAVTGRRGDAEILRVAVSPHHRVYFRNSFGVSPVQRLKAR